MSIPTQPVSKCEAFFYMSLDSRYSLEDEVCLLQCVIFNNLLKGSVSTAFVV